jgi:hypothetical protein
MDQSLFWPVCEKTCSTDTAARPAHVMEPPTHPPRWFTCHLPASIERENPVCQ